MYGCVTTEFFSMPKFIIFNSPPFLLFAGIFVFENALRDRARGGEGGKTRVLESPFSMPTPKQFFPHDRTGRIWLYWYVCESVDRAENPGLTSEPLEKGEWNPGSRARKVKITQREICRAFSPMHSFVFVSCLFFFPLPCMWATSRIRIFGRSQFHSLAKVKILRERRHQKQKSLQNFQF